MATGILERVNWKHETQGLQGKSALITGGTTGIGRAIALLFASQGAKVFIFGREQQALDDAIKDIQSVATDAGGSVQGTTADQSRWEEVQRVFREVDQVFGGLDILVANAAVSAGSVLDSDYAAWEYAVKTNLLGYMACARLAMDRFQEGSEGQIVFVGSMSADVREQGSDVYVATKAGIAGFVDAFRKSANEKGIRVTLVEPGLVGSDLAGDHPDTRKQEQQMREGTMLSAEDIAEAVLFSVLQPARCNVGLIEVRPTRQIL